MMSDTLKGIDAFLGILKGRTNGAHLSIEEINEAIAEAGAEAGMAGIAPGIGSVNVREGIEALIGRHADEVEKPLTIEEMNQIAADGWAVAGLAGLVAGCTPGNLHPETDFGPPVGREIPDQDE